jgi:hypothetical protein
MEHNKRIKTSVAQHTANQAENDLGLCALIADRAVA